MKYLSVAALAAVAFSQATLAATAATRLVPPSPFHGVHGLRFGKDGMLYAASVIGQTIYKVDVAAGKATPFIAPPDGMADDLDIAPDGSFAWTSIEDGIFHFKSPGGPVQKLMEHQKGVNGVSFSRDGKRLFVSLVFYGDALFEVDRTGAKPPRKILENIGGLNGFQVDDDGMIYGPLWFKGKIVKINPDTAQMTVISDGFKTPAAVKLDFHGHLYTPDTGTQELIRVDIKTGRKKVVAKLRSDLDNLAISSKGLIYVSLSHLNAIDEVDPETGKVRQVIPGGALITPSGLAVSTSAGKDSLLVGDVFGDVRTVDGATGKVAKTPVAMFQPCHVSLTPKHLTVVSNVGGVVQVYDRATYQKTAEWTGFTKPGDALEAPNGEVIVADTGNNALVRVSGRGSVASRKTIAASLAGPTGLAWAGTDAVYLTETASGTLSRVDLKTGAKTKIADKLERPEGVAALTDGALVVVEVAAKRVTRIDLKSGARTILASNLPVGLSYGPSLYRGIAASASAVYVASDIENTIYKIALK